MVFLPDNTITGLPNDDVIIGTPDSDEVYGFVGNDVIIGAENIDLLYGNEDADLLYGSQGDDTLYGGQADDVLFGGQGNDFLSSNKGNDTLYGDQGADTLIGGIGSDVIVIGRGTGGSNLATADVMTDFDVTLDQIQLLDGLSYSDLTIESTGTGGTVISEAITGEVFIVLEGVAPVALTSDRFIPILPPPPPGPGPLPEPLPPDVDLDVDLTPPTLEAQLVNDTGSSDTDNITSDPTISGTVTDSSGIRNLEASFGDEDEFIDVSDALEADGTFTLNLTELEEVSGGELTDGDYTLLLRSQDTELNTSQPISVSFSLDATAPEITAELVNDTGDSDSDGVTSDPTIIGTVTETDTVVLRAGFGNTLTNISSQLSADGSFTLNPTELEAILGEFLDEESYSLQLEVEDDSGQVSEVTVDFNLKPEETQPPEEDEGTPADEGFIVDVSEIPGFELLDEPVEVEPGVFFLGTGLSPEELRIAVPSNVSAADTTNADQLWDGNRIRGLGLNLSGDGITVGVWDGGNVLNTHQEFGNRVILGENSPGGFGDHATHVAGTIGASGVDPDARGMANQVEIVSYDYNDDLAEIEAAASQDQLYLSNHSYSFHVGWETRATWPTINGPVDTWFGDLSLYTESQLFGRYSGNTAEYDRILYDNPDLLSIWAAGNERDDSFKDVSRQEGVTDESVYVTYSSAGPAGEGWYQIEEEAFVVDTTTSLVAPPPPDNFSNNGYDTLSYRGQTAKNTLVVGAVNDITEDPYDSGDVSISSFSSWGPTDDGRVKPDVVGNGVGVYSPIAESNNSYDNKQGTSMAAPNVTGTAALLYEHHENLFGFLPTSATGKGLLIHTANDAGNVGPDYIYGWGVVDGVQAANFLTEVADDNPNEFIVTSTFTNRQLTYDFDVTSADIPLKATLVWTDPPGQPQSGLDDQTSVLVNDLDLWITDEEGTIYNPWTLNPDNPTAPAQQDEPNVIDNVEQVFFDAPSEGTYTIHVGSRNRVGTISDQDFSLLVSVGEDNIPVGDEPPPEEPPEEPRRRRNPIEPPPEDPELPPLIRIDIPRPFSRVTDTDLYTFSYSYGGRDGDVYYGYTYEPEGTYFPGEFIFDRLDNETGSAGFYYIEEVFPGWGSRRDEGDVYVTSYFDRDFTNRFYQPYDNFYGFPSGEDGLGSEYDFIYKSSPRFGSYYEEFGLNYYSG
ncbi:MAG: S8 family serine peptidase [Microcoleaceae cyanobacterium]